jgi:phage terminase Nu1 subunit (DNA packaging protein)
MPPTTYTTQSAFAKALDIHPGTLSRLLRQDGFPVRNAPPWTADDVATVQRWRLEELQENRAALAAEADEGEGEESSKALKRRKLTQDIRKVSAQADAAELVVARERGAVLDAADVERTWAGEVERYKADLLQLPTALAIKCAGHSEPDIQRTIEAAVKDLCRKWQGDGN